DAQVRTAGSEGHVQPVHPGDQGGVDRRVGLPHPGPAVQLEDAAEARLRPDVELDLRAHDFRRVLVVPAAAEEEPTVPLRHSALKPHTKIAYRRLGAE